MCLDPATDSRDGAWLHRAGHTLTDRPGPHLHPQLAFHHCHCWQTDLPPAPQTGSASRREGLCSRRVLSRAAGPGASHLCVMEGGPAPLGSPLIECHTAAQTLCVITWTDPLLLQRPALCGPCLHRGPRVPGA